MADHTQPRPDKGAEVELLHIGAQMANVMFNLAQRPGEPLTGDTVAIMDSLRKKWDAARRSMPEAVAEELPPLPEPDVIYEDGKDEWGYVAHSQAYSVALVEQIRRDAIAADRQARASVPAAGAVQQPVGILPPLPEPMMGLWSENMKKAWADQMRKYGEVCARAGWDSCALLNQDLIAGLRAQLARQSQGAGLLREARAALETWKDVAPAVSLCTDIDRYFGAAPAPGNTAQPTAHPVATNEQPSISQPRTWQPITKPGQVKAGDKLRFTIGDDKYIETARQILHPGTDGEEIIYNKRRNYYLITSMAMANKGSQKNVEFFGPVLPGQDSAKESAEGSGHA